jgi:hypothetical protein
MSACKKNDMLGSLLLGGPPPSNPSPWGAGVLKKDNPMKQTTQEAITIFCSEFCSYKGEVAYTQCENRLCPLWEHRGQDQGGVIDVEKR